jgi:hypothetical protein
MMALAITLIFLAQTVELSSKKPYDATELTGSRELRTSTRVYRLFFDKKTQREIFRIQYGQKTHGEWVEYWLMGLIAHGDLNQDGKEDYAWYAGDDTSSDQRLILSTPTEYRQFDLFKLTAQAWRNRFKLTPPDIAASANDYDCRFAVESGNPPTLIATIAKPPAKPQTFRIPITFTR